MSIVTDAGVDGKTLIHMVIHKPVRYLSNKVITRGTGVTPRFGRLITEPPLAVFDIKLHQVSLFQEEF